MWHLTWGKKKPRGTRVFKTRVPPFYFPSSSSHLFVSVHSSSLLKKNRPPSHWRLDRPPVFFSNQITHLTSLHSFVCSSSLLKTRSSTQSLKIISSTGVLLQPDRPPSISSFFFSAANLQPDRLPLPLFFFKFVLLQVL